MGSSTRLAKRICPLLRSRVKNRRGQWMVRVCDANGEDHPPLVVQAEGGLLLAETKPRSEFEFRQADLV